MKILAPAFFVLIGITFTIQSQPPKESLTPASHNPANASPTSPYQQLADSAENDHTGDTRRGPGVNRPPDAILEGHRALYALIQSCCPLFRLPEAED